MRSTSLAANPSRARFSDLPSRPQIRALTIEIVALAVHCPQEALRTVERAIARGQAAACEERGEHAVAGGESRVERLHHRAEVLFQPGGLGCGDGDGVCDGGFVQLQKAGDGSSRSDVQCHPR